MEPRTLTELHFSGMVGQLVRNEAEIGSSPLFMTIDRVSLIQYIAMPTPTGSRFVFRSPKLSFTDNVFLLPFDNLVWCCLIGLVIVTASCLMIAVVLEWKYSMLVGDKVRDHVESGHRSQDIFYRNSNWKTVLCCIRRLGTFFC